MIDSIKAQLEAICHKREILKEQFLKTWLAVNVPDENMTPDYLVNHVELVEQWSEDRLRVSWHLRFKEDTTKANELTLKVVVE